MTWRPGQPGFAAAFLADWDYHARNFVPELVRRIDADDWIAKLEQRLVESGDDPIACRNLVSRLRRARDEMGRPIAEQLLGWLGEAVSEQRREPFDVQDPFAPIDGKLVKWPTGMPRVDAMTGGGYGLTVFGGRPKLGKSLAAMAAAIEAAAAGWSVVYVNAELTERETHERVMRYVAGRAGALRPHAIGANFVLVNANPGFTARDLIAEVAQTVSLDTDRILIVLDSINRLVNLDLSQPLVESSYWDRLRAWSEWPRLAARLSDGRVSVLVVSELNQREGVKGGNLEYDADLVVKFTTGSTPDRAQIDVALSRSTASGECGEHERDWRHARFVSVGSAFA